MRPLRLRYRGFANLRDGEIEFPQRGLVLVQGRNGSGKSAAFLEALSIGLWNRPVRSRVRAGEFWREGGELVVETTVGTAVRTAAGLRSWSPNGAAFETTQKGQAAIEALLGTHEAWRRAAVLSATDADDFATATDGDQKRLLELLLGLTRFDAALRQCRQDAQGAEGRLRSWESVIEQKRQERERLQETLGRLERSLAALPAGASLATLQARVQEIEPEAARLRAEIEAQEQEVVRRRAAWDQAQASAREALRQHAVEIRRLKDALRAGACDLCQRPFVDDAEAAQHRATLQGQLQTLEARSQSCANELRRPLPTDLDPLSVAPRARATLKALFNELVLASGWIGSLMAAEPEIRATRLALRKLEIDLLDAEMEQAGEAGGLRVLEEAERILGLQGARALLLSEAVSSLEPLANLILYRMGNVRVAVRPHQERRDGQVVDRISIDIQGAGRASAPYGLVSGGQRRRVDVALLFALAQLSQKGNEALFLDEICDSPLDQEGREGLLDLLQEESERRLVVLITHEPSVLDALRTTALLYDVQDGVVRSVT